MIIKNKIKMVAKFFTFLFKHTCVLWFWMPKLKFPKLMFYVGGVIHILSELPNNNSNRSWKRSHLPSLYITFWYDRSMKRTSRKMMKEFCVLLDLYFNHAQNKTSSYIIILRHVSSTLSYDIYMIFPFFSSSLPSFSPTQCLISFVLTLQDKLMWEQWQWASAVVA